MNKAFPIINRPDQQPKVQRWTFHGLTTLAWLIWLYLWLPAVTLFAWALGFKLAGRALFEDADLAYLTTLADYGLIIAMLALVFMLWSAYNRRRFRGRERRKDVPRIDLATIAADVPLSEEAVDAIMHSRKVTIRFDDSGLPCAARVAMAGYEKGTRVE